ncbi:MAG TPA: nuclear transport factor 2 family protein [Kofleriaceae bacterium]|nr:nuclear transport factor 2 family protein [Kofleriaceae bacterium]
MLAPSAGMTNPELAKRLLVAWTSGEPQRARALLRDDVEFNGPLGVTKGADQYVEGVTGFAKEIDRVDVHNMFGDGEDVCLVYDLVTKAGAKIPTAGVYKVVDGKIASVRAYFDPRPLIKPT